MKIKKLKPKQITVIKYGLVAVFILGVLFILLNKLKKGVFVTIWNDPPKIDTTILKVAGDYPYQNTTNNFSSFFKNDPTVGGAVKFTNTLSEVSFSTPVQQSFAKANVITAPVASKNTITYKNVFNSIDIRYSVDSKRLLEEFIVANGRTAATINEIKQNVQTKNIDSYQEVDGGIVFNKGKEKSFVIPKPVMYEAGNINNKSYGIEYKIKENGKNKYTVSKVINAEGKMWLSDAKRNYPIVIDLVIDNADTASDWVSSDETYTVVSQETSIKHGGTGSVKVQTTNEYPTAIDLMEYSTDTAARAAYAIADDFWALGGTIATASGYTQHSFLSSATFTFSESRNVEALVVGGGGTGGYWNGGGGGAGGLVYDASFAISSSPITVTVGNTDQNSVFSSLIGYAGGAGGAGGSAGSNGGCGGGGGSGDGGVTNPGGTGSQGGDGAAGAGYHDWSGGGGGMGADASLYNGGNGVSTYSSLLITANAGEDIGGTHWVSGGAGGCGAHTNGVGGAGGGGDCGAAGLANTGGGGGAGTPFAGGSGVVIARYATPPLQVYTEATIKSEGSYALKGVAAITSSLNQTYTRTVSPTINLTGLSTIKFDIRSNRTGSNIKVGIHDSGGTTTEVTPNINPADAFQTITWDISGVSDANKDAIDQIIITIVNADAETIFYVDNFYLVDTGSLNDTVTLTKAATDLSGVQQLSYWVRSNVTGSFARFQFGESASSEQTNAITISSADTWEQKTWDISAIDTNARNAVTKFAFQFTGATSDATFYFDDIASNTPPTAPTLSASYLHDKVKVVDTTPEIRFNSTDIDSDDITYQVSWDTDSSFPGATTKTSDTDAGFANVTTPADPDPFTQGNTVSYTFQSALTNGVTYFYRVRAKDPNGSNTYGSWSAVRSFTIDTAINKGSQWFETHADQFDIDTKSTAISINNAGNYVEMIDPGFGDFTYRKPVTLTNGGTEQTNYDVLISLDTATLISDGKMQADCDDLRVTDSDKATVIDYWIEGGCNTATTQIWARVPVIPNGTMGIYLYYGDGAAVNAEAVWTGKFITLSVAACSGTWTRNTDFDLKFPKGAVSYGGTGGLSGDYHHDHTVTGTTNSPSLSRITASQGSSVSVTNNTHTHTVTASSTASTDNLPPYLDMIFCENNDLSLTTNSVGLFAVASQTGWTQYTSLNSKFPRGNSSAGGTGGYSTHSHTFSFSLAANGSGSNASCSSGCVAQPVANHSHVVSNKAETGTNIPAYLNVVYFQKDSAGTLTTERPILMFNTATLPLGWERFTTLDDRFPQGSATYSGSSSTSIHTHSSTQDSGNADSTANTFAGSDQWDMPNHGHTVTYSSNSVDITPPYVDAVFAQRKSPTITTSLGAEEAPEGTATIISTALTAANLYSSATNWGTAVVGKTETTGTVLIKFYYDNSGTPTIIPNSDLAGNSLGFSTSTIDLATVSTSTYPIIYLKAYLNYSGGSPRLNDWNVMLDNRPATPSLDSPTNTATSTPVRTVFKTTSTDGNSDYLQYKIIVCTNSGMTENCQTFDQTSSGTGWSGMNANGNTAYASGTQATYTVQTILNINSVYYWKSYAKDIAGTALWSDTQASPYSFTTSQTPNTPTLNSPTNAAIDQSIYPDLKATATDPDSDYLQYKFQLCTDLAMTTDCQTYNQNSSQSGWSGQNADGNTAYTSGTQGIYTVQVVLTIDTTYFWRGYSYDPDGSETWSPASGIYSFTTGSMPPQPTELWVEGIPNPPNVTTLTPGFSAMCNGFVGSIINKYRIQVDDNSDFSSVVWDSGAGGTAMTNCNAGDRSSEINYGGSALSFNGNIYYWRISFRDNITGMAGLWSTEFAVFTMDNFPSDNPTKCTLDEAADDSYININWNDNSSSETGYTLQKNTNGAGFIAFQTPATNVITYHDTAVTQGNTYQYRVKANGTQSVIWCTTPVATLNEGIFSIKGLNLKGINLR